MSSKVLDLSKIVIEEFIPKKVTRESWKQFHEWNEKQRREIMPKDNLPKREVVEKRLMLGSPDYHSTIWSVFKDENKNELIGFCSFGWIKEDSELYKENKKIVFAEIRVDSDNRRQGLGTKLLKRIVSELKDADCRYFETTTYYSSSMNFCEKFGAKIINIEAQNRLYIENLNWEMVENWMKEGQKRNPEVKIEGFYGFSEKNIEEYCKLLTELENEAPTLEDEDEERFEEIFSPKRCREFVDHLKERTNTLYTLRSIEPDGKVSGTTEIFFSDENLPERVNTGLTGVKSIYRGRGLGKWLKASMMQYIKENLPKTEYIITGNADHNAPMLTINIRLGFKHYLQRKSYKFTIDKLLNLL